MSLYVSFPVFSFLLFNEPRFYQSTMASIRRIISHDLAKSHIDPSEFEKIYDQIRAAKLDEELKRRKVNLSAPSEEL